MVALDVPLLVLVALSGHTLALPAGAVAEMVHEPALIRPPVMPVAVAGLFRLRGRVVPVLRPERLLALPPPGRGLFRVLVVIRGAAGLWALLVERALAVAVADELAPVPQGHSFGDCVLALADGVPVLAPERLLQSGEAQAAAEFAALAERRWKDFALGDG